jgi:hypothetical protein
MVMLDDTIAGRRIVPAVEEVTVSTSCVMKDAIPTYAMRERESLAQLKRLARAGFKSVRRMMLVIRQSPNGISGDNLH